MEERRPSTLVPGSLGGAWRGAVPLLVLVAVDLIPLAGVLWFGWDLLSVLVLFWLESGVIGVINVFKIVRAAAADAPNAGEAMRLRGVPVAGGRGCLAAFFVLHYGIFWLVHGVFVFVLPLFAGIGSAIRNGAAPQIPQTSLTLGGMAVALLGLAAYHVLAYWYVFVGQGEYRRVTPSQQMFAPYGRVVVLHVTILVGAFLVFLSGQPLALVALLVGLKTAIDVLLYLIGRRRTPAAVG